MVSSCVVLCHYLANKSKSVPDQNLPNFGIGRGSGFMEWPPGSLDLGVYDFWDFCRKHIYFNNNVKDDSFLLRCY